MRRLQKGKRGKPRKKTEPLAEGIIPLDRLGRRRWKSMSEEEIVEYAREVVRKEGLKGRKDLEQTDYGLYQALNRRKLMDRVIPESSHAGYRDFGSMGDDELVRYAQGVIYRNGLKSRTEMRKTDSTLYKVLLRRKLMYRVGLESSNSHHRDWDSMGDDDIVELARKIIKKKELKTGSELYRADSGLCVVLRRRKLLGDVFPDSRRSRYFFTKMSDSELVEYSLKIIEDRRLEGRKELEKADYGLYQVLIKRKLLDRVFSSIESKQQKQAVQEVVDAMKEFE